MPAPADESPPEEPIGEPLAPAAEAPPATTDETPAAPPAAPPPPPAPIMPAGPQVVPRPAELRGPRVVRIEAPEPVRTPRPRPAAAELGGSPGLPPAPGTKRPGRGRSRADEEEAARQRARTPRRHDTSSEVAERVREFRDQDWQERRERLASATGQGLRDRRAAERRRQAATTTGGKAAPRRNEVEITAPIILKEFCSAIGVPFAQVMRKIMEHTGQMMAINQSIDGAMAELLALDFGIPLSIVQARSELEKLVDEVRDRPREHLEPRPPVVAMLGHVDHGKTSLLDRIRHTSVAKGEAGGITQHIGASRIDRGDWHVTLLDTPGHEAFTSMRARGANLTDVVVLVVAADDGVMPQTVEAIAHAKAAGVAIVIALNKIDLPGVDLNRIYAQLAEHELTPTEWGGSTDVIKTSATTGQGVDDLLAHLSTLSELLELKADPTIPAVATVIESEMAGGQGVVARVLVQEGTLRTGQVVVCGPGCGRIRSLSDPRGGRLKEAPPGTPVAVVGLDELPNAGDRLYVVDELSRAKAIAEEVRQQRRAESLRAAPKPRSLESLLVGASEADVPTLNVILKGDTQGSVETLKKQLGEFPSSKAVLRVLHAGVGAVSEADVALAQASHAIIIGFHVVADDRARHLADEVGVEIRTYRVIYEILDDLHKALLGLLEPLKKQEVRATVEVRQVFKVGRVGTIAGCYVTDGTVARSHKARLVRDGRVMLEGAALASLRRFKDDVREVRAGFECGIKLENFDDLKPGDRLEMYEVVEVSQEL
jgi:translation initiation factor IF-2